VAALAAAALLVAGAGAVHISIEKRRSGARAPARAAAHVRAIQERAASLVAALQSAADQVAAQPDALPALGGDRGALARLFRSLETLRAGLPEHPSLAVHAPSLQPLAWADRLNDLRAFRGVVGERKDILILQGSVSTFLVATAPVRGPGGAPAGVATATLTIAVRRNIRNDFLSDFDVIAGTRPGVEIRYVDARDEPEGAPPFSPLPTGERAEQTTLRAPDGSVLAALRVAWPPPENRPERIASRYRWGVTALAFGAVLAWSLAPSRTARGRRLRLAASATLARGLLLALGPALPDPRSPVLSPDTFASPLMGPLLRSPLDLFLTASWLLVLAVVLFEALMSAPAPRPSVVRAAAVSLLAVLLLGGVFYWIADTVANTPLDIEAVPLLPRSPPQMLIHLSLLFALGTGMLLLTILLGQAGDISSRRGLVEHVLIWAVLGALSFWLWPRHILSLPLAPAVLAFLVAALAGGTRQAWAPRLRAASLGARAGLALAGVAVVSLLLYPSLVHYGEKNTRLQIERDHAPLVLRQPQWREYVLASTQRRIDSLNVLEEAPPGPYPPDIEELAFAVWSVTDLAAFGFTSAVEIQDATGAVISRFALNVPSSLDQPRPAMPAGVAWEVSRDRLTVGSEERRVLHARRLLSYHSEVHGAIHLYVGEDFWNLPFIVGRDPYSVLHRSSSGEATRDRPIALVVYDADGEIAFTSVERPPALLPALKARVGGPNRVAFWETLTVDGRAYYAYVFSEGGRIYALGYPRLETTRYAAGLVEAAGGLTLIGLGALALVTVLRSLLGRPTLTFSSITRSVEQRFALRLFVAFTLLAFVPVAVLQVVVRGFVADRLRKESENQALERAAVAKKAVEDFAQFQRGEAAGDAPVTDAALVWVASLIRNDLDVFDRGRLQASSKRELYASGLLAPQVPGRVYRALVLEGQPYVLRTETIGGFSFLAVSVPVHVESREAAAAREPGILSMPLALRQKEEQATLEDLDRKIRLASVVFFALAALLAQSMARRISGPLRDLTQATQRVAEGDLQARVTATSRDELRALVEAFNRMAGDLDRQRRALERSNRLAAWAEMARQVAHEVKNPLTPIQLSAEHLRRVFGDPKVDFAATLETCTQTILKQVRTLRGIVTEFSAFARPPAPVLERQDLKALVGEALRPYQPGLPPGVTLSVEASDGVPSVMADRRLIERAVVNLLENALQAVGEDGAIRVRLRSGEAGRRAEIEIEDTGAGIDATVKERLFEPFFSTKTSGSGLGLALVKRIAEDHGGGVSLEPAPGRGTRAVLWLPAEPPAPGP
jgi:signal transduction histidine kinase